MVHVDAHAHTYLLSEQELKLSVENKILVLNNGTNELDNELVLKEDRFLKAIGWWPLELGNKKAIEKQARTKGVIAIGEIGLDYHRLENKNKQIKQFKFMLNLAKELNLPVSVHSRKAEKDVLNLLQKNEQENVILHSFQGKKELIRQARDQGYTFSVPSVITRDTGFQTLVKIVPLKQILTETDAPYLAMTKGERSNPSHVIKSVKKIEELTNNKNVEKIIYENFQKMFKH